MPLGGPHMSKMEEIRKAFAEKLGVEELDESKALKDLGLDSLDVVEMCLDMEEKAGVQFETSELASFKTVGDLLKALEKKLG